MTSAKPLPDECREAFEKWYSNGDVSSPAIRKDARGEYVLMQAYSSWTVWQACWNTRPAPTVPTGYKLVPIEPTEEMLASGLIAAPTDKPPFYCQRIYKAMLSAAPENKGGE